MAGQYEVKIFVAAVATRGVKHGRGINSRRHPEMNIVENTPLIISDHVPPGQRKDVIIRITKFLSFLRFALRMIPQAWKKIGSMVKSDHLSKAAPNMPEELPITKSLSENSVESCGEGFWLQPRRRGRSIPAAGCDGRANAGRGQKTRRPEGFRGEGWLASLLLGRRPLRVSSLGAPRHPAFSAKTGLPRNFQTGSEVSGQLSRLLSPGSKRLSLCLLRVFIRDEGNNGTKCNRPGHQGRKARTTLNTHSDGGGT